MNPHRVMLPPAIVLLCLFSWAGCAPDPVELGSSFGPAGRSRFEDLPRQVVRDNTESVGTSRLAMVIPGSDDGLALHQLTVQASNFGAFTSALARWELQQIPGLSAESRQALRANGFRLVRVPIENLDELLGALPIDPWIESTWLGRVHTWLAVASGRRQALRRVLRIDDRLSSFDQPGRFRLLIRSYRYTDEDETRCRFEMISQFHLPRRDPLAPDLRAENLMGIMIPGGGASFWIDDQSALIVTTNSLNRYRRGQVPARLADEPDDVEPKDAQEDPPGATTVSAAADPDSDLPVELDPGPVSVSGVPGDRSGPGRGMGPLAFPKRTIGQEILTSAGEDVVLVLIFVPRRPAAEAGFLAWPPATVGQDH